MAESRELSDILERVSRSALAHVHTSCPAKVTKFDPLANTVDVELVTKADFYDPETRERDFDEKPSTIGNVPVIWPRGGGYVMTLPLAAGDFVWLMFSEQALGEWRTTGQTSEPADARRHSIGYPFALPGAFPDVRPLASADVTNRTSKMVIGEDGGNCQIVLDKALPTPTILLHKDATQFVALANLVQAALDTIETHTHPVVGATAGVSPALATLGPVAAVGTKAK